MKSLANHSTPMRHKDQHGTVELKRGILSHNTKRNVLVDPALAYPIGDQGDDAEGCRSGETFEVFCFAVGVFGDGVCGYVEPG